MPFFINPKRFFFRTWRQRLKYYLRLPFIRFGLWLGFPNIEYSLLDGEKGTLKLGKRCSTMNTLFNTACGMITVGDNTIFGYNCMVITGTHLFYNGKRASLQPGSPVEEVVDSGNDIKIGSGCFICSGSIISKGVTIGDNVIIGAGSVVVKDIPSDCFVAGAPAEVIKYHDSQHVES